MKYTIGEIAKILGIKKKKFVPAEINNILTDSRILLSANDSIFFAIITKNNDGHKYVDELYNLNVRNFVVSQLWPEWENYKDVNFLLVRDTLSALQVIAKDYRQRFDIPIVGITGSNGKTVVKEWLFHVLFGTFNITRSPRSFNSQIGVPLSVWQLTPQTQLGIFEAGISEYQEMEKLESILQPTIGIFTNLGQAHQEGFDSIKEKCIEKLDLFINSDVVICEEENAILEECMQMACLSYKRFTWSRKGNESSAVHILSTPKHENGTMINFSVLGLKYQIAIPFSDKASIENAIHVITTCMYLKVPFEKIKERFRTLERVTMRLDVREGVNNCSIVNDTYSTDLNSLKIALDFLVQRATSQSQKRAVILSDIPQSGIPHRNLYEMTSSLLKNKDIDILIGIGEEMCTNSDLFHQCEKHFFLDTQEFLESGIYKKLHDTCILLKGARAFCFEEINKVLEQKHHETVLEVNLDAIVHNYNFFRGRLRPETKIICMVKADAYGSGSNEIAKTLQHHQVDYLAVAIAAEGISLRKAGIKIPIIVLNSEVGGFDELYEYDLEPEVYNFRILNAFIKEAQKRGCTDYPIHIKVDTGMHRLGFVKEDIPELVKTLKSQEGLKVKSLFSHLAASESWNFDAFTQQQIDAFLLMCNKIQESFSYKIMRHVLNSAGIERFDQYQFDMVRLGISLYGISASGESKLQPVHTLKTTILQIKEVAIGETVGYGRKALLEHDSKVATIRIGYADGLDRRLGNGVGYVLVNGLKAPYLGNICMDLCMIDVSNIDDVNEGDYVTVMGGGITPVEVANKIGTIPYEILTSISSRVKHVYFKE